MFKQNIFEGPGTGTFSTHTFEILLMLAVAALIGLWMGWLLWGLYKQKYEQLLLENTSLRGNLEALQKEIKEMKDGSATLETDRASLEARIESLTWENSQLRKRSEALEGELERLRAQGRQMAAELGWKMPPEGPSEEVPLEIDHSADVLDEGDISLGTAAAAEPPFDSAMRASQRTLPVDVVPTPEQEDPNIMPSDVQSQRDAEAKQTAEPMPNTGTPSEGIRFIEPVPRGTMIPLEELTEPPVIVEGPTAEASTEEDTSGPSVAVLGGPFDDLKVIEGIGPKIEKLLFEKGITTYGQLAATSVQQLKDILAEAGPRYAMHDPGTWSAQALLAANGEWENLKAYQEFLHAGKRPEKP